MTDAGLRHLAARPNLAATLTALSIDHTAALDGSVGQLLALCTQLRALSLRGLLFNADATVELAASNCRCEGAWPGAPPEICFACTRVRDVCAGGRPHQGEAAGHGSVG